jgi:hypothetical protein
MEQRGAIVLLKQMQRAASGAYPKITLLSWDMPLAKDNQNKMLAFLVGLE